MVVRSVFKFLSKTCTFPLSLPYSPLSSEGSVRNLHARSYSQPPHKLSSTSTESLHQLRTGSKSLENLRGKLESPSSKSRSTFFENRHSEEDYEDSIDTTDLLTQEPGKEDFDFTKPIRDRNPIYELAEGSKSDQTFFDIISFFRKQDNEKSRLFMHLQPSSLKPYGSTENAFFPHLDRTKIKIVYPGIRSTSGGDVSRRGFDDYQRKEFSSYRLQKVYPGYEEPKKIAVCKSSEDVSRRKFTTSASGKSRQKFEFKKPKLTLSGNFTRRSSTAVMKKAQKERRIGEVDHQVSSRSFDCCYEKNSRKYSTQNAQKTERCSDYVTVKLGDLQEQCRKERRCKAKKMTFGRLPKILVDCPCVESLPLKEGKPFPRLKKRFSVKPRPRVCPEELKTCVTPRADSTLKVVPKTLPTIKLEDCPCEERQMTDFVIKRLPKKRVPEPARRAPRRKLDVCVPRADAAVSVKKKPLPKFQSRSCPCYEEPELKNVSLKRLTPKPIKEPERVCPKDQTTKCEEAARADRGLKIERKTLPRLRESICHISTETLQEGKPIRKLKKVKIEEKPREPCFDQAPPCVMPRADNDLKITKKKLPAFVPEDCPCPDVPTTSLDVKLKRLVPKIIVKEKPKICKDVGKQCPSRADAGLKVEQKRLPKLQAKGSFRPKPQPVDVAPLKKLVPKPVQEPKKVCKDSESICVAPRSDHNRKVEKKRLQVLPPGHCPCVPPPLPEDVAPLKKLKKKPVQEAEKVCPADEDKCMPNLRADANLKVEVKMLPILEIKECPCVEPAPVLEAKPLRRLKKKLVVEPIKVCQSEVNTCEQTPRADVHDWLYWKRVEVKPPECDAPQGTTRSFGTFSSRSYCTGLNVDTNVTSVKYDLSRLFAKSLKEKPYNIRKGNSLESFCSNELRSRLALSKLEPVDSVAFKKFDNGKRAKEGLGDASFARSVSTCSILRERGKLRKDRPTPSCECPPGADYLQPKNPIVTERENFVKTYPGDEEIADSKKKELKLCNPQKEECEEVKEEEEEECTTEEALEALCLEKPKKEVEEEKPWWQRVVNYFKARDCPSPEEFKRMRLREEAERAASKAGLCLYDPKELLKKNKKEMPKVITADTPKEDISK